MAFLYEEVKIEKNVVRTKNARAQNALGLNQFLDESLYLIRFV